MARLFPITLILVSCLVATQPQVSHAQDDQGESIRKITNKVAPAYPPVARMMHLSGQVKIEVVVAPNGTVKSLEVKGGHPALAEAATSAIRKWKWAPATHETREPITVKFDPDSN